MMVEKIFSKNLTLPDYQKIMLVNYLVHSVVEPEIEHTLSSEIKKELDFDSRRKTAALLLDVKKSEIDFIEDFFLENNEEALGAMYVLEGATLGGNIIRKQLKNIPQFKEITFHYYGIYQNEMSKMWTSFLEILDKNISSNQQLSVLKGAEKTYRLFISAAQKLI